jgi:hypothetical protein
MSVRKKLGVVLFSIGLFLLLVIPLMILASKTEDSTEATIIYAAIDLLFVVYTIPLCITSLVYCRDIVEQGKRVANINPKVERHLRVRVSITMFIW